MKKSTIGVFGVGEVGNAIVKLFEKKLFVLKKDINVDTLKNNKIDVLHVCIPYTNEFEKIILKQCKKSKPRLLIIHSTVKPGTTTNIYNSLKIPTVHSPIMGTHDNLAKYILKFKKIIGPSSKKAADFAKKHLEIAGISSIVFNNPEETELGKLLDTSYYGWNIIFNKLVWYICQENNIDFNSVYTKFNQIYNEGYKRTKPEVLRPNLKFVSGAIGGHCIIPNLEILEDFSPNLISQIILEINNQAPHKK